MNLRKRYIPRSLIQYFDIKHTNTGGKSMSRSYEDLSRRALVQLGKDYDADNNANLLGYLQENDERYEGIRPVEKVIQRTDEVKQVMNDAGITVKNVVMRQIDKVLDCVVDAVRGTA